MGEAVFKHKLLSENTSVAQDFKRAMLSSVVNYQRLTYELKRICALFEKEQIPHMPLKGAVIRKLYPDPWMRTSGDIDILVKKEDAVRAAELLEKNFNYKKVPNEKRTEHDFGFYSESGIPVELHYDLMEKDANYIFLKHKFTFSCSAELAWESAVKANGYNYRYLMDDDIFYIYNVSHAAKHFINGGCGIRYFLDLWILNNNGYGKSETVKKRLGDDGLTSFWNKANKLTQIWFNGGPYDELTEKMTKYILAGGIHGSYENKTIVKKTGHKSKLALFMSWLFVPYKTLKFKYKGLENRPYLLPFYWVWRWITSLKPSKFKKLKNESDVYDSFEKNDINEIKKMFSDLEII